MPSQGHRNYYRDQIEPVLLLEDIAYTRTDSRLECQFTKIPLAFSTFISAVTQTAMCARQKSITLRDKFQWISKLGAIFSANSYKSIQIVR